MGLFDPAIYILPKVVFLFICTPSHIFQLLLITCKCFLIKVLMSKIPTWICLSLIYYLFFSSPWTRIDWRLFTVAFVFVLIYILDGFFFFYYNVLFLCLFFSWPPGWKHSHSVFDQQSRAWQDSQTVDQEIRHINCTVWRSTRHLYNVQHIFIAFTIRTSVYMLYWFYSLLLSYTVYCPRS